MAQSMIIAPSLLASDFTKIGETITMLENSAAQYLHIDVMDGHFVPNLSMGIPIVKSINAHTDMVCDVHLMIEQPELYIDQFAEAGADIISIHYEATNHVHRALEQIKTTGAKVGLALNPHTPVHLIKDVLYMVDQILIMSVNPGFGGQKFIDHTLTKLAEAKTLVAEYDIEGRIDIEVDGGVTLDNIESCAEAGANVFVSGSGIFKTTDPTETITKMQETIDKYA